LLGSFDIIRNDLYNKTDEINNSQTKNIIIEDLKHFDKDYKDTNIQIDKLIQESRIINKKINLSIKSQADYKGDT